MPTNLIQDKLIKLVESQFFERLGIKDLTDQEIEAYKSQLLKISEKRLANTLIESLSKDEIAQLDTAKTDEEIAQLFKDKDLNLEQLSTVIVASVLQEIETDMAYINGLIDAKEEQ